MVDDNVTFTYNTEFARKIFRNKIVAVLGDSVMRNVYKDLVLFLQSDRTLTHQEQKQKAEDVSGLHDRLLHRTPICNGKGFFEVREYQTDCHVVQFYFITRCYNERVKDILQYWKEHEQPDLVLMNSCLWDISRYNPHDFEHSEYMKNMATLCSTIRDTLPSSSMFLWLTTLPVSSDMIGGFLTDEVLFQGKHLRIAVLDANRIAAQVLNIYGFDILDLHYFMRSMLKLREKDGVHWNGIAHRHISELIISFIVDTYDIPLPDEIKKKLWNINDNTQHNSLSVPSYTQKLLKTMEDIIKRIDPEIGGTEGDENRENCTKFAKKA